MSYKDRESFYTSPEWRRLREIVIQDRIKDDGFLYCEECGKPILKKYDIVLHHKTELNDINVMDATISLNPEKIEVLHFGCHNKQHDRFGHGERRNRKVYIVYGPPCAGKTSWVNEVAGEEDLIVDMDSLWEAVGSFERYHKPGALKSVVFSLRDRLYDIIQYRDGKWRDAYVITGGALSGDRQRLKQRLGADELIYISASMAECIARASQRSDDAEIFSQWKEYIEQWYDEYQPEEETSDETTPPGRN